MFDILPSSAIPADVPLSRELIDARNQTKKLFKDLPPRPERDSVLSTLGRMGKSTLKRKIRYRAQVVMQVAEDQFPELFLVTDEAVNCRNHSVHGSKPSFEYREHFQKMDQVIDQDADKRQLSLDQAVKARVLSGLGFVN